jgi:N-acetylmuramic acid 6-phosphate etherase
MPPTFGIEADRFIAIVSGGVAAASAAVENAEDDIHASIQQLNMMGLQPGDILFALAASGSTPFALSAVKHAKQKGVWTCGIANNKGTPLLDEADLGILLDTGPEVLTGSTRLKAGTSQKLVLNQISTGAMVLAGKVIENLMVDVKASNAKLRDRCVRITQELTGVSADEARAKLDSNDWNIRAALVELGVETN